MVAKHYSFLLILITVKPRYNEVQGTREKIRYTEFLLYQGFRFIEFLPDTNSLN